MSGLDDMAEIFRRKLEEQAQARAERLEEDLQTLRARGAAETPRPDPQATEHLRAASLGQASTAARSPRVQGLLHLSGAGWLNELDSLFADTFHLARYAEPAKLAYPTVYCESLEEFFTPMVRQIDLSEQARQQMLAEMIAAAREQAERREGGTLGYNLPGVGCYINGWLLSYGSGVSPRAALEHPELRPRIVATAVHEKLGHGFLEVYSTLGQVKSRLGATIYEIAARFGLRPAESAVDKLREEQTNLVFKASQLVEEGWATWVENFLPALWQGVPRRFSHRLEDVVKAVKGLPPQVPNAKRVREALLTSLQWLFGEDMPASHQALQAVIVVANVSPEVDEYFGSVLGQPLRYAVGELLYQQAEARVGAYAMPYLALIAANVDPQPEQIGLSDLRDLLSSRPDLNPDARLALLSRLKLENPNDVAELARRAEAELSLTVPPVLKQPRKEER